jgi:uncharacterized protein (DUF4415 family)
LQQEHQQKLESAGLKYSELEAVLKSEKEALKLLRFKFAEQESTIAKQLKEKEDAAADFEKRTKELISVRAESEFRYKLICEKQNDISEMKKTIDKLEKERDSL